MFPVDLMTQPCTITTPVPSGRDAGNNPTFTAGTPVAATCFVEQPRASSTGEALNAQDIASEVVVIYFPPSTTVTTASVVTVGTAVYNVTGLPFHAFDPLVGAVDYIQCLCTQVVPG